VRAVSGKQHRSSIGPDEVTAALESQLGDRAGEPVVAMLLECAPALVDAIAEGVAARLAHRESEGGQHVDAQTIADRFGVARSWVYEHADELGAVRLGRGPRARLRFDADQAAAALNARTAPEPVPANLPQRRPPRKRQHASGVPLLPIASRAGST
jgi:hypothetical protein